MTDATTTYLGLTKPTVGADSDNWGGLLNGDLDQLDALWANIGDNAFGTSATKAVGFFLQAANNLSDLTNATTARTNLGLGSAALAGAGASGHVLPFLDAANSWSAAQTFAGGLTGNVTGDCSGSAASCTGNAATATNAAALNGANYRVDFDGTNIRFLINGSVVGIVSPTTGFTNEV